jgi:tetratricopeptide (TPR) repeat protein
MLHETKMRRIPCLVSGACVFIAAQSAFAQTDLERATARDAANNGRAAFDAGKYEKAIDYLSRAEQLVHSPTHLLFIARAQTKLGRLVAAHETYLKISRETLAANAPKAFVSAQAAAEQEQDALDDRLPSVTVTLQGATTAPDVTVQMDGTALPAAMIGIPLPTDPGEHVFKASGPTIISDPVTVRLAEAAKQTVTLTLRGRWDGYARQQRYRTDVCTGKRPCRQLEGARPRADDRLHRLLHARGGWRRHWHLLFAESEQLTRRVGQALPGMWWQPVHGPGPEGGDRLQGQGSRTANQNRYRRVGQRRGGPDRRLHLLDRGREQWRQIS